MESVFIRSKIKNNNLKASNDAATKSDRHPGRESTRKKKSVHIRVHPCPTSSRAQRQAAPRTKSKPLPATMHAM